MARMSVEERRKQLVAAAIAVMTREGVRAATTRAIVAEADTSLSVFHYCFESKDQLLLAVADEMTLGSTRASREESPDITGDPLTLMATRLEGYWEHLRTHPDQHLLTYEITQFCLRNPALQGVAQAQYKGYTDNAVDEMRAAGMRTTIPLEVVGRHIALAIDGITMDWLVRRDDQAVRDGLDALLIFFAAVLEPAAD